MSDSSVMSLPLPGKDDETRPLAKAAAETTPGGTEEIEWKVAMKTAGLLHAQIMADRLQAEGIPAHAWQEGAGQALGLTVGLLGQGYVMVPAEFLEQAKEILAQDFDEDNEEE